MTKAAVFLIFLWLPSWAMLQETESNQFVEEPPDSYEGMETYEPPSDVFDLGYNEWYDERLGREFDVYRDYGLGLNHNEFFDAKIDEYSPEYRTIYSGSNPGWTPLGFQTFRTVGPWTTRMYAFGFHLGKVLHYGIQGGTARILTFVPRQIPYRERARTYIVKTMTGQLPDKLGKLSSGYGNLYDDTDVMSYNTRRMMQIVQDPNTYHPHNLSPLFR